METDAVAAIHINHRQMTSEFAKYDRLKLAGVDALGAYLQAKNEGMDRITATRMLRKVYELDLMAAKTEIVRGDAGGLTLSEYQENLLPALKAAFQDCK
ncbi:MAG: hypothetical protein ACO1TE_11455 [Prosthecobacter sp.]